MEPLLSAKELAQRRVEAQEIVQERVDAFLAIAENWPIRENYKDEPGKSKGRTRYRNDTNRRLQNFITFVVVNEGKMLPEVCAHLARYRLIGRFKKFVIAKKSGSQSDSAYHPKISKIAEQLETIQ